MLLCWMGRVLRGGCVPLLTGGAASSRNWWKGRLSGLQTLTVGSETAMLDCQTEVMGTSTVAPDGRAALGFLRARGRLDLG
jgi:hypothetical protein